MMMFPKYDIIRNVFNLIVININACLIVKIDKENFMRVEKKTFNLCIIFLSQILAIAYSLISKKLLLDQLPFELVGISSLFETLFLAIGLIDIGFMSLLSFNLYKSVNEKNDELILAELSLFKKIFNIISVVICIISICLMPFLTSIFKIDYGDMFVVYSIYVIYLFTTLTKFRFTYKICLLNVYRQEYIHRMYYLLFDFICFILKVISIVVLKSYISYIFSIFITGFLTNYLTAKYVDKHLGYTQNLYKLSMKQLLDSKVISQCKKYIYKSLYDFVFFATDNLIIGMFLNTKVIGYLSNYNIIFSATDLLVTNINYSMRNHLAKVKYNSTTSEYYNEFTKVSFVNFMITSIIVIGLFLMRDDFINLWIGNQYVFDKTSISLIILTLAINLILRPVESIYMIGGFAFKERKPLMISALTNLFLSVLLLNYIGVIGVYIATFISTIIFWCGKLYYVLKYEYTMQRVDFLKNIIGYFVVLIITFLICGIIVEGIVVSGIVMFIVKGVCITLTVATINSIIYITLLRKG